MNWLAISSHIFRLFIALATLYQKSYLAYRFLRLRTIAEKFCMPGLFVFDAVIIAAFIGLAWSVRGRGKILRVAVWLFEILFYFIWLGVMIGMQLNLMVAGHWMAFHEAFDSLATMDSGSKNTKGGGVSTSAAAKLVISPLKKLALIYSLILAIAIVTYIIGRLLWDRFIRERLTRSDYCPVTTNESDMSLKPVPVTPIQKTKQQIHCLRAKIIGGFIVAVYLFYCILYPVDDRYWPNLRSNIVLGFAKEALFPIDRTVRYSELEDSWIHACPRSKHMFVSIFKEDKNYCSQLLTADVVKQPDWSMFERKNPSDIRNVVMLILESTRGDTFPIDYSSRLATKYMTEEVRNRKDITPFMDSLVQNGLFFSDARTSSSLSAKSDFATFCSSHPYPSNMYDEKNKPLYNRCLPEALKSAGFFSAHYQICKEIFGDVSSFRSQMKFMDIVAGDDLHKYVTLSSQGENLNFLTVSSDGDDILTDTIVNDMKKHANNKQPFFISFHSTVSHHPFKTPPYFAKQHYSDSEDVNEYLNSMHYNDFFVQDFVEKMKKEQLMENTLLIVLGDHGTGMYDNSEFLTTVLLNPHDGCFNIPLLFYTDHPVIGPYLKGFPKDSRSHVRTIDIVPTIFDILAFGDKIAEPDSHPDIDWESFGYDGHSIFYPHDHNEKISISLANIGFSAVVARYRHYKYIYYPAKYEEFFDLKKDPTEADVRKMVDLSAMSEEDRKAFLKLKDAVRLWIVKTKRMYDEPNVARM